MIVVNTAAGVTQEVKAGQAIAALSQLTAPEARVLRDGGQTVIPAADVVTGDVLVLAEGDIVPADAAVVEVAALLVDESALTGESVPAEKAAHSPAGSGISCSPIRRSSAGAAGRWSRPRARSAEPPPATQEQRAELILTTGEEIPRLGQWITGLAAQRRAFADKLAERQSLLIPAEDPGYKDSGPAFPAWQGTAKDAILQPPKP